MITLFSHRLACVDLALCPAAFDPQRDRGLDPQGGRSARALARLGGMPPMTQRDRSSVDSHGPFTLITPITLLPPTCTWLFAELMLSSVLLSTQVSRPHSLWHPVRFAGGSSSPLSTL